MLDNGTELNGGVTFENRDDRTFVTGINYELFLTHEDVYKRQPLCRQSAALMRLRRYLLRMTARRVPSACRRLDVYKRQATM